MNWRILLAVGLALVLAPPPAWASHMGNYAANPVEHDDEGRSDEPDGFSTSIGGVAVSNHVIQRNPASTAPHHVADASTPPKESVGANVLAPGCSVGFARAQSGLCGIHTVGLGTGSTGPGSIVPAHTVPDVPGVSVDDNCPNTAGRSVGRYENAGAGPLSTRALAFLDHEVFVSFVAGPANYNDINHKIADLDSALGGALHGVLGDATGNMLTGLMGDIAWFGVWGDLNCNGVIDHSQDSAAATPTAAADNEFIWLGGCTNVDDLFVPDVIAGNLCIPDPNANSVPAGTLTNPKTTMYEWVFPGNHHGFLPSDVPGGQVVCLVDSLTGGVVTQNLFGFPCTTSTNLDDYSAQNFGDPIFDDQNDPHWDELMDDRTGESDVVNRQWVGGLGWPVYYYDQSLITTTVETTGVNCPQNSAIRAGFDVNRCAFTDVDR